MPYGLQTPDADAQRTPPTSSRRSGDGSGPTTPAAATSSSWCSSGSLRRAGTTRTPRWCASATRRDPLVREALERMWPVLTPAELLNDLFGSGGLLRSAAERHLDRAEWELLRRPRHGGRRPTILFTHDDVPLLDEALELLGPRPRHKDADAVRTYGHIVVDEAQDLTPMQLRVLDRRSLNGSMTIVGDIAQATGSWPHDSWDVGAGAPARAPPTAPRRADRRLPGPRSDHGVGRQGVAARSTGSGVAVVDPPHRRVAGDHRRQRSAARRRDRRDGPRGAEGHRLRQHRGDRP